MTIRSGILPRHGGMDEGGSCHLGDRCVSPHQRHRHVVSQESTAGSIRFFECSRISRSKPAAHPADHVAADNDLGYLAVARRFKATRDIFIT